MLPIGDSVIFHDSTFFSRFPDRGTLPLPHDVRAEHLRTPGLKKYETRNPPLVRYTQLNLVVKFGSEVTIAEGQCLWALRKLLSNGPYCVPVPEIYGWRTDGDQVFIYQELVTGVTLADRWNGLEDEEKKHIVQKLKDMVHGLRLLQQDPSDVFIGHIGRQKLLDKTLPTFSLNTAGPFRSVKEFHDWFFGLLRWKNEPYRRDVPDDAPIVFTHADFDPSNIIVPSFGRPEILALVDWHGAGWYPAYWEYSKAIFHGDRPTIRHSLFRRAGGEAPLCLC
ncbi:kinase-like domain-containing protein [Pyronema domesticum]|nr:kinase-like domain-containing protein [Pyronema domesticum]